MASRTRPRQLAAIFTNQQDTGGDRRLAGRNGRSATPTKTAEAGRRSRAGRCADGAFTSQAGAAYRRRFATPRMARAELGERWLIDGRRVPGGGTVGPPWVLSGFCSPPCCSSDAPSRRPLRPRRRRCARPADPSRDRRRSARRSIATATASPTAPINARPSPARCAMVVPSSIATATVSPISMTSAPMSPRSATVGPTATAARSDPTPPSAPRAIHDTCRRRCPRSCGARYAAPSPD